MVSHFVSMSELSLIIVVYVLSYLKCKISSQFSNATLVVKIFSKRFKQYSYVFCACSYLKIQ